MEHPELNVFRRLGRAVVAGAYVEGWGLYAERLADELGLYRNDGGAAGDARRPGVARVAAHRGLRACTASAGRASSRSTGCSDRACPTTDAAIETDRYIAWPGQALSYMTGMREIRRLRQELEARDGDRFDIKAFHDELIGHGSLPLVTLATELPRWVRPKA